MLKKSKSILLLSTMFVIIFSFTACGISKSQGAGAVPTLVKPAEEKKTTVNVKRGDIEKKSNYTGSIIPSITKSMAFKGKGGYLSKLNVKFGDSVKKGDILAELDKDELNQEIQQEQIQMQLAQIDYDEAIKNNASDFNKERFQLKLDSEKMKLNQLNDYLKNSELVSDMTGVVIGISNVTLYQHVDPFQPLVVVADKDNFEVQCNIENVKLILGTKVQISTKATIAQPSVDGQVVSNTALNQNAVQSQGSNNTDGTTQNTNKIIIKFDSPQKDIKFGDDATVTYTESKVANVLMLPTKAIKNGAGNHPYVELSKNGDITEKYIETGVFNNDVTEVVSGLTENDTVIVD